MKMITLGAIGALTLAMPAFAQMQPSGPADSAHGGARGPIGSQPMDDHRGDDTNRGHGDGVLSGREYGMDHHDMGDDHGRGAERGYDRAMDHGRGDRDRGYGRHCRTVWHHHHKIRRCD